MRSNRTARDQGFTLIELLVVMAIIATLAGLGMVGIPRIMRQADKTAAKNRLNSIYKDLVIYHTQHNKMPRASGAAFVLATWESRIVDHTVKDAEIYFDPSTGNEPEPDFANVTPEGIDWTGPDQEGSRRALRIAARNANDKVIVCNKIPMVQDEADLDEMPHAGKGMVYLTLGGTSDWIDAADFGDYVIIGPESPVDKFQQMVPGYGE